MTISCSMEVANTGDNFMLQGRKTGEHFMFQARKTGDQRGEKALL